MTSLEQLEEWVKGNPIHDQEQNQCCPDFSCCDGDLSPQEERDRFRAAYYSGDDDIVQGMLVTFLSRMLKKCLKKENNEAGIITSKDIIN